MPKASINKYYYPFPTENKIRIPKNYLIAPPADDPKFPQYRDKNHLRVFVATRPDAGHHVGAFRLGKYISHYACLYAISLPAEQLVAQFF